MALLDFALPAINRLDRRGAVHTGGEPLFNQSPGNLLTLGGDYAASATKTIRLRFSAANNPTAQNPGALTFAEYAVNPDSANGTNILRGVDKAVKQQQLSLSFIRHDDGQGTDYSLTTFGLLRNIDNPLATPSPILRSEERRVGKECV